MYLSIIILNTVLFLIGEHLNRCVCPSCSKHARPVNGKIDPNALQKIRRMSKQ